MQKGTRRMGTKKGGRKRHSKSPPHNYCVELLFSAHRTTTVPLPKHMSIQTDPHRESLVPKRDLERTVISWLVFVALSG